MKRLKELTDAARFAKTYREGRPGGGWIGRLGRDGRWSGHCASIADADEALAAREIL